MEVIEQIEEEKEEEKLCSCGNKLANETEEELGFCSDCL